MRGNFGASQASARVPARARGRKTMKPDPVSRIGLHIILSSPLLLPSTRNSLRWYLSSRNEHTNFAN